MLRRRPRAVRCVAVAILALAGVAPALAAEPRDERYAGLALTYYFGDSTDSTTSADLSLGAMERTVDLYEDASVTHLPLVMVPLLRRGEPLLAPVSAVVEAVKYVGTGRWITTGAVATCGDAGCIGKTLALPDLGAR